MEYELGPSQLFPASTINSWWDAATDDYGWLGRDLVRSLIKHYIWKDGGKRLRRLYNKIRARIARSITAHPRTLDMLAAAELGHYLVARQLLDDFRVAFRFKHERRWQNARRLRRWAYKRLAKEVTVNQIVDAIAQIPSIGSWVARGFIPTTMLQPIAKEFGLTGHGVLTRFLRRQQLITGTAARQVRQNGNRAPVRCYILSDEGKKRLTS
jgi:AraC-like DNA-binding protein